jgi:hypothetical protein
MPCCALILSLLAQPVLVIPGVRRFLAHLMPTNSNCCESPAIKTFPSFFVRGRVLLPFFALEMFLFSIGTAGALEMLAPRSVTKSLLRIPICSVVMHGTLSVFHQD